MTNLDYIKQIAKKNPEALANFIDDVYCVGWNDGASDYEDRNDFSLEWLNSEVDEDWFVLQR